MKNIAQEQSESFEELINLVAELIAIRHWKNYSQTEPKITDCRDNLEGEG